MLSRLHFMGRFGQGAPGWVMTIGGTSSQKFQPGKLDVDTSTEDVVVPILKTASGVTSGVLLKIASDGSVSWQRAVTNYAQVVNAAFDTSGNIYMGGATTLAALVCKFNSSGTLQFKNTVTRAPQASALSNTVGAGGVYFDATNSQIIVGSSLFSIDGGGVAINKSFIDAYDVTMTTRAFVTEWNNSLTTAINGTTKIVFVAGVAYSLQTAWRNSSATNNSELRKRVGTNLSVCLNDSTRRMTGIDVLGTSVLVCSANSDIRFYGTNVSTINASGNANINSSVVSNQDAAFDPVSGDGFAVGSCAVGSNGGGVSRGGVTSAAFITRYTTSGTHVQAWVFEVKGKSAVFYGIKIVNSNMYLTGEISADGGTTIQTIVVKIPLTMAPGSWGDYSLYRVTSNSLPGSGSLANPIADATAGTITKAAVTGSSTPTETTSLLNLS